MTVEATFSETAGATDTLEDASALLLGGLLAICGSIEVPVVMGWYKVGCQYCIWYEILDTTTPLQMSDILPQVNDEYAQKEYWCALGFIHSYLRLITSHE